MLSFHGIDEHLRIALASGVYAIAYALAAWVFWCAAKRRGLATDGIGMIMAAGLIGGLIGANLLQDILGGAPGKTIEGGILGGWLAVILVKRHLRIIRPTGDLFALAIAAGEAVGRIACFIGGCCYGKMTNVAWSVYDHGAWRHPTQLYLALWAGLTFGALAYLDRRRILPENGIFIVQGLLFCLGRFVIENFRDVPAFAFGLTSAQYGAMLGLIIFGAMAIRMGLRQNARLATA